MKLLKTPLMLAAAIFFFASCERNNEELEQANALPAAGEAETNSYYDDTDAMASEAVANAEAEGARMQSTNLAIPGCAVVTRDVNTRTITIDFGAGCRDSRGNLRTGKLLISRSGRIVEAGGSFTTSLQNYSINGIAVEGTRTVTNVTTSTTATPQFTVTLRGGRVTWPDGTFAQRQVNHLRTWIRASNPANDEWHVSGTASGMNREGQEYTSTITSNLIVKLACRAEGVVAPVQGSLSITRPDKPIITLDFGSGSCDNEAMVSMNGRSRTITVGK